ncbi:beta strand repeat-containing protein, partial [Paraburkholderia sp. J76]|uniref:beta strand repeat-containing protein n=1 Tax=Paraburkholderia sp. J76 TaxID=2805439 RepID=UPI0039F56CCC
SASGPSAIAIGQSSTSSNTNTVAIGASSQAIGFNSEALGAGAQSAKNGDMAMGGGSLASGGGNGYDAASAMGYGATAQGADSVALGVYSSASAANATALGANAKATVANSVALGQGSVANTAAVGTTSGVIGGTAYTYAGTAPTGTVSVGVAGAERTITNVAAGRVTATSTDAVNGSQLYAADSQITANTNSITTLNGQVTTLQGNVTTLQGNVTTLNGQITSINSQITNLNGKLQDAVMYDSSAHTSVTLGGSGSSMPVTLHNVANGTLSAASTDAVNGSQLYATNTNVSNIAGSVTTLQGNVSNINSQITNINGKLNDAVLYDSSAHTSVTLGGSGSSTAVALHNVANGTLSASSTDAVNGSQLYATNTNVSNIAGSVTTLQGNVTTLQGNVSNINSQITNINGKLQDAVLYDSSAHTSVTLGGSGSTSAVALHNVANGTLSASSTDAVNGSQLYATNTNVSNIAGSVTTLQGNVTTLQGNVSNINSQITNINGKLQDAVLYDSSAHTSVTLGGSGSTSAVALHNVANGVVNASSLDGVNGSQLYALASSDAAALGGGSTVNSDGSISNPTYVIGGKTFNNVGGALTNLDGSITNVEGQITNINGKLQDAVLYDSSAHTSITLGGAGSTTAVSIHNVANGTLSASSADAVNGSQLYATNQNVTNIQNTINNINDGGGIKYFHTNSSLGDSNATGANSTAIGPVAAATATSAIAIGNGANAATAYSVALGNGATTSAAVGTASGVIGGTTYQYAGANPYGVVSVGAQGAERQITNVAAGQVTSSSTDAVNGSQLYATDTQVTANTTAISNIAGSITNIDGKLQDAVMYDSSAHTSVTLGGTGATSAVALHNVANGLVNASSFDAVNGSQLYALASSTADSMGGGSTVNGDGSISNPTYVIGGKTFNNAGDAFTSISGDITNINGTMADAVMYDSSAHDSVTLGGTGATSAVALHNVANGAVNASSLDAVNGSQLYNVAASTANVIGGGSTVNSDGSISNPTFILNGGTQTYRNVAGAITNLDGRVTQNTSDITNITNNINNG